MGQNEFVKGYFDGLNFFGFLDFVFIILHAAFDLLEVFFTYYILDFLFPFCMYIPTVKL